MQKYLFDTDFAPSAKGGEEKRPAHALEIEEIEEFEPPPPPPPGFSEEDVAAARGEAYQAGYEAARREALGSFEKSMSLSLASIESEMRAMDGKLTEANAERIADSVDVARAIIKKMFPELAKRGGLEEIVGVVKGCVGRIDKPLRIIARVCPEMVDPLREKLDEIAKSCGFEGKMVVVGDPRIALGDCRVEWGEGGAERDAGRIALDIDKTVNRSKAGPSASEVL